MKNQSNSANFNGHHNHETQKRKWPYAESNSYNYAGDKGIVAKKSMTTYNYDNFQPNYIISSNGQEQRHDSVDASVNCSQSSTQMLNAMELSENIEYVNILYEDDLLTNIQAPVATESNYINFEPNWGNADILDLDQRNYYYENTNTVHLSQLNGQLSQHNEHDTAINHQQITHDGHLHVTDASNSHIHHVTEYEIVQTVYPEAENQREKSNSNLRKCS